MKTRAVKRCGCKTACLGCPDCLPHLSANERHERREREEGHDRASQLLGYECARNDPLVVAALQSIHHGATVEEGLATAVRCLSQQNLTMMKDLVAVAQSRPMFIEPLKEKP